VKEDRKEVVIQNTIILIQKAESVGLKINQEKRKVIGTTPEWRNIIWKLEFISSKRTSSSSI